MPIDISKPCRTDAIASIQRYFEENLPEPFGDLPASLLLEFFLDEICPVVYDQAIADGQKRMQQRVLDLSYELYLDPFQHWPKADSKRKSRR